MKKCLLIVAVLIMGMASSLYAQKFEGLAMTPPMGWNSWNKFGCNVNEKMIMEMADAMVESGMKDAGYEYIVIDDCWHGTRDENGFIQPDPETFPSGIKALADYIHSKGLKFGIYSCAGDLTCAGEPGSRGYEYQDALQYARWGVDYLKYDWCSTKGLNAQGAYTTMSKALKQAGRPIVFSLCEWGGNKPWTWAEEVGHLWRTTGDIGNVFDGVISHGSWRALGVMQILDLQVNLREYAGPGHWNDPDMLEVGNGMAVNEDRAHFTMWCMLAAPLMSGNDIREMSSETRAILMDKDIIAIDQDALGIQAFKYSDQDGLQLWLKPLSDGDWAVCFLNRSKTSKKITYNWKEEVIKDEFAKRELDANKTVYDIRNLWAKKNLGNTSKETVLNIPAQDVVVLRLTPSLK